MDDRVPLPRLLRRPLRSSAPEKGKSSGQNKSDPLICAILHLQSCKSEWIALRVQVMIIDYGLSYPSGTATATLINGFHTPQGAKEAKCVQSVRP